MVVSSKSKAKYGRKQHVRTLGKMVVISPSAAKDALPPRAVAADKGSAGEKSEYILRRARVVPQRVRGRRLSFTFFLPLLFMMLRSLDLLSLCQGDGSCLFHSLQCREISPSSLLSSTTFRQSERGYVSLPKSLRNPKECSGTSQ